MDLNVESLSVIRGDRRVLDTVSARFVPGRINAILGPNGAGKSSLVKAMAGLLAPARGRVRYGERSLAELGAGERARTIGYLPQDGAVHWDVTVAELVALGRLPHRAPFAGLSREDEIAIADAMAATEVKAFADRPVSELSGGERARVLLARVLAGQPKWLLADEPLASLDPAHQLDILDRLREAAGRGMGVVIVLHDLVQAARAAHDVLLLSEGRVAASGPPDQALAHQPLRDVFGVEVMIVPDNEGRLLPVPLGRRRR